MKSDWIRWLSITLVLLAGRTEASDRTACFDQDSSTLGARR
jgi:hypothetical protein